MSDARPITFVTEFVCGSCWNSFSRDDPAASETRTHITCPHCGHPNPLDPDEDGTATDKVAAASASAFGPRGESSPFAGARVTTQPGGPGPITANTQPGGGGPAARKKALRVTAPGAVTAPGSVSPASAMPERKTSRTETQAYTSSDSQQIKIEVDTARAERQRLSVTANDALPDPELWSQPTLQAGGAASLDDGPDLDPFAPTLDAPAVSTATDAADAPALEPAEDPFAAEIAAAVAAASGGDAPAPATAPEPPEVGVGFELPDAADAPRPDDFDPPEDGAEAEPEGDEPEEYKLKAPTGLTYNFHSLDAMLGWAASKSGSEMQVSVDGETWFDFEAFLEHVRAGHSARTTINKLSSGTSSEELRFVGMESGAMQVRSAMDDIAAVDALEAAEVRLNITPIEGSGEVQLVGAEPGKPVSPTVAMPAAQSSLNPGKVTSRPTGRVPAVPSSRSSGARPSRTSRSTGRASGSQKKPPAKETDSSSVMVIAAVVIAIVAVGAIAAHFGGFIKIPGLP